MSGSKQLFILEEAIFDIMEKLHYFLGVKDKPSYELAVKTLNMLNEDYKELTGEFFLEPERILSYYSKLWEMQ